MNVLIGPKKILEDTPKLITISNMPCILCIVNGEPKLYSADCPHQHGVVEDLKPNVFRCPNHNYTYEPNTGKCMNAPQGNSLHSYKIFVDGENVFAEMELNTVKSFFTDNDGPKIAPKITLVSNACLLIQWKGFNLLTDPWIEGKSLFGAWINYPQSGIRVKDLPKIDAIWITHGHSDHLHPYTLNLFDKETPIYVPHFADGRLHKKLKKLGFKNVTSVKSSEPIKLRNDIDAMSIEQYATNLLNDSIVFLKFGNFKFLNLNDAGFNWKIIEQIGSVDLICGIYTYGASAYPLNWTDIDDEAKKKDMIERNLGMLRQTRQILELCSSKYFLPFAHFCELVSEKDENKIEFQIKNTPHTVKEYLKDFKGLEVLDLIPGDIWDGEKNQIIRNNKIDRVFERKTIHEYMQKNYYNKEQDEFTPKIFDINETEIKNYFESFSNSNLAQKTGNYKVQFTAFNDRRNLKALISFSEGKVTYESNVEDPKADMSMSCPGAIVQEIIQNDLNWDEILYWSTFYRNNHEHNIMFWKMLHAPWIAQKDNSGKTLLLHTSSAKTLLSDEIKNGMAIATILERGGTEANRLMEKYGLFCITCEQSVGESLVDGCRRHGINDEKTNSLILELEKLLEKRNLISH